MNLHSGYDLGEAVVLTDYNFTKLIKKAVGKEKAYKLKENLQQGTVSALSLKNSI